MGACASTRALADCVLSASTGVHTHRARRGLIVGSPVSPPPVAVAAIAIGGGSIFVPGRLWLPSIVCTRGVRGGGGGGGGGGGHHVRWWWVQRAVGTAAAILVHREGESRLKGAVVRGVLPGWLCLWVLLSAWQQLPFTLHGRVPASSTAASAALVPLLASPRG